MVNSDEKRKREHSNNFIAILKMYWWLLGILAIFFWGTGYAFLKPLGTFSPFVLLVCYALVIAPLNLLVAVVLYSRDKSTFTPPWVYPDWLLIIGYILFCNAGSWCFLWAVNVIRAPVGIMSVMTGVYPVVTLMWTLLLWRGGEEGDSSRNPALLIPGVIFCILGPALLAAGG
jgi:drug/metabolite transporter (DMT)-like permease